jgi:hypothetical protein
MFRHIAGVAIALVAIGALVVGTSSAQAPTTETIVVQEGTPWHFKWVQGDRPRKLNPGDVNLESGPLNNPATDTRAGGHARVCTYHFGQRLMCTQEISLRGRGTIQAQGVIHLGTAPDELVIVGGTGDFVDIGGTIDRTGSIGAPRITINIIYH